MPVARGSATPQPPTQRALPAFFRWLVLASAAAGLALRAHSHQWDPSLFLQLVFVGLGLGFAALRVRADRDDAVLRAIAGANVAVICVVIVTSGRLTVPTIAPFAVIVIALGWAMLLRQFRTRLFVVPLIIVGPLLFWGWHSLHQGRVRDALLHVRATDLARVEMRSPDGSRTEVLASDAQRANVSALLASAMPLYPNHEGIADAWQMRLVMRDGTTRDLWLGHGSRSRSHAWLQLDEVNEFELPQRLEDVLVRLVPDPARETCEAMVRAVCAMAARCNPTGRINLLVPGEGTDGVISFFSGRDECVPSYLHRRCDQGGVECVPGEAPHCVDLDAVRFGASRAVQVPAGCADLFREPDTHHRHEHSGG